MTRISGIGLDSSLIITNSIYSAAGQIAVGTGPGTAGILSPGTNGQVLSVDTTVVPYKLKWVNPAVGTGDVVGPASSVDLTIACFSGTTGKLLLDTSVTIDASSNIVTTGSMTAGSFSSAGAAAVGSLTSAGAVSVTSGGVSITAGGLTVSAGGAAITGNSTVTGTLTSTGALTVSAGGATITAGGLTVSAGGAAITGNSTVTGTLTSSGALTVSAGGAAITGNSTITGTLSATNLPVFTTKGQLVAASAADTGALLNIGSDGQVLTADSAQASGMAWKTPATYGDVSSSVGTSTDNALVRMDSTTGKLIQSSGAILSDANALSGLADVSSVTGTFSGAVSVASLSSAGAVSVTSGGVSITAGGLTVSAGGAAITGNSTVTGTLTSSGALTVSSGGAAITGNSTVTGTLAVSSTLSAAGMTNTGYVVSKYVTAGASPYSALATDYYISVSTASAVATVRLPDAPTTGRVFVIKDKSGNATTYNITVTTVGGAVTIDGSTSFTIDANYGSISVIFNGTSYEIF
jgi:hypothetical protein